MEENIPATPPKKNLFSLLLFSSPTVSISRFLFFNEMAELISLGEVFESAGKTSNETEESDNLETAREASTVLELKVLRKRLPKYFSNFSFNVQKISVGGEVCGLVSTENQVWILDLVEAKLERLLINNFNLIFKDVSCGNRHCLISSFSEDLKKDRIYMVQFNNDRKFEIMDVEIENGIKVNMISCGLNHSAVIVDHQLYTFGWGLYGQLGHGSICDEIKPKRIEMFTGVGPTCDGGRTFFDIKAVSCGRWHTIVVSGNNDLYSFGWNKFKQVLPSDLSDNQSIIISAPELVDQLLLTGEEILSIHTGSRISIVETNKRLRIFGTIFYDESYKEFLNLSERVKLNSVTVIDEWISFDHPKIIAIKSYSWGYATNILALR